MDFLGIKKEQFAPVYMAYLLSVMSLLTNVNVICGSMFGSGFIFDTAIVEGLLYALMVLTFATNGLKLTRIVVGFLVFAVVAAVISMIVEPGTRMYILGPYTAPFLQKYTSKFFIYCFSGFIASSYINDTEYFFDIFEKFCYITVFFSIIAYYLSIQKKVNLQYMTFSYNMLLQVTFLAIRCMSKFSWKKFIFAGLGIFIIFIAGCRGALVSCFLSIVVYSLMYKSKNALKKGALLGVITIFMLLIFFNFEGFMQGVVKFLDENNIQSRTVSLILEGNFLEDSGRSAIQERLIDNFNLFGHGMYSDRLIDGADGSYAHSIMYELIYQYGTVLGSGIFIGLCLTLIVALFKADNDNRVLIISLLSTGFTKLFFSGSYLNQEPSLYVLLGLCIVILKERKQKE